MASVSKDGDIRKSKRAPARTPEARERHLINMAQDVVEKQMEEGTVSATVLTHYLKLATTRDKKELTRLDLENRLLEAKTAQISSQTGSEKLAEEAIKAFRHYAGQGGDDEDDY